MQNPSGPKSTRNTIDSSEFGRSGWLVLAALTVFAFVMRFWRLAEVPPGLFYDEAFNGLDTYYLLSQPFWEWPIFFTGNHGREPLYPWLLGISQGILGHSIWTIRLIPALCAALLPAALVWLGWEVAPHLGVRNRRSFALWTGVAILTLLWSQIFARYGLRLSLFVLLETLLWANLWKAWGRGRRTADQYPIPDPQFLIFWAFAGLFAGLSFYTYLPSRLLPLILLPMVGIALWRHRAQVIGHWRGIVIGAVIAVIVAAPLGIYFIQNPVSFTTRIGQVSVVGRDEGGIVDNVLAVAGMFTWEGDHNPRSNIPFRPAIELILAPFFVIGLAFVLWRFWRLAQIWLLTGFGVMLLPTILSEFAPNFQRAIGALPFIVIFIGYGLDATVGLAEHIWRRGRAMFHAVAWGVLIAAVVLNWRAYFVTWASLPDLFPAWDVGFTRIAEQIVENDQGVRVYISPRGQDHPTLAYLLEQHANAPMPEGFDGRICMRVATDVPAHYYFLDNEDFRGKPLIGSYFPDASLSTTVYDVTGSPWADKLEQPAGGRVTFPEMIPQEAQLGDGIDLRGYWLYPEEGIRAGERLYTRLYWGVSERPHLDYTAFSHLVHIDPNGTTTQIAGADRPPGEGTCPTVDWLPGEVVIDELQFVVPDSLSDRDGQYYLEIGFYTPQDGRRLDVPDNVEDHVLIGPLKFMP